MLYILAALPLLALAFSSCEEKLPQSVDSPDVAQLLALRIVNAGPNGNQVVEGVVDENTKRISFPRLDPATDLSKLRFEAEVSSGASLEKNEYSIEIPEGGDRQTVIVKVVNNKHFREYFAVVRLLVPVYGADFENAVIHDLTAATLKNTHPDYKGFGGLLTRGAGYDGKEILIVSRGPEKPHLLHVSDVVKGEVKPVPVNMEGVALGTFAYNLGEVVNGHVYIMNLCGIYNGKLYHWKADAVDQPAENILLFNAASIPGAGKRYGDNFSITLDAHGDGYVFLSDNAATNYLRFTVKGYTQIDPASAVVIPCTLQGSYGTCFAASDKMEEFLFDGLYMPLKVGDKNGNFAYTMKSGSIPLNFQSARVVNFNGERFLIGVTCARNAAANQTPVLYVYDITKGATLIEALQLFEEGERKALLEVGLQAVANIAPSTNSGYYVEKDAEGKDSVLHLFGFMTDAGCVVVDIPAKKLEED